jgi:F-type H+-transporting ATPase subunit gamma
LGRKQITLARQLAPTRRIAKAQERVTASLPYSYAITDVLTALASTADINHPLLVPRPQVRRAGVLVITSDRGLCGAYNANAIRTCEELITKLKDEGKQVQLYVVGRKGVAYYTFRGRELAGSWTGFSEQPTFEDARTIGETLIRAFEAGVDDEEGAPGPDGILGVDELHVVHTRFRTLMTQTPVANFLAPMQVEEVEEEEAAEHLIPPAYEYEPDPDTLFDALLPKYINTRIYAALLDAAASEWAARRRAMKSAADNAEEVIQTLTRQMNSARQAEITQEISEIVGGANALAAAGSEE